MTQKKRNSFHTLAYCCNDQRGALTCTADICDHSWIGCNQPLRFLKGRGNLLFPHSKDVRANAVSDPVMKRSAAAAVRL
jgi:hypothetical protein